MSKSVLIIIIMSLNIAIATLFETIIGMANLTFIIVLLFILSIVNYFLIDKLWFKLGFDESFKESRGLLFSNLVSSAIVLISIFYIIKKGIPLDMKYDPVLELIIINIILLLTIALINSLGMFFVPSKNNKSRYLFFIKYFGFNLIIIIISVITYLVIGSGLTVGDFS